MSEVTNLDYTNCPPKFRGGMKRYLENKLAPGGFLIGVLTNDLAKVMWNADSTSLDCLKPLYEWIYNEVPSDCWGSEEVVLNWLNPPEPDEEDLARDLARDLAENWINGNLSHVRSNICNIQAFHFREALMEQGFSHNKAELTTDYLFHGRDCYQEACDAD